VDHVLPLKPKLLGGTFVKNTAIRIALFAFTVGLFIAPQAHAQKTLLAIGTLDQTRAGSFADLSGFNYTLENAVPANSLGGFGSALAYASGNTFFALPDRGPNAAPFVDTVDDTVSYINRFHIIRMHLNLNPGPGLPFTLTPELRATIPVWSPTALFYGAGGGTTGVGPGAPPFNSASQFFFTGRSDNFDPAQNSGDPADARFDTEGMRLSNDARYVFISDEYGPYVYQFDRLTGKRIRSFTLPASFYVTTLSPQSAVEIASNTVGRVANKGMEGLAITPDGTTLVGFIQAAMEQDTKTVSPKPNKNLLRIVTIDIASGTTHQYGYLLTAGSGVSEILAINNHEFLVDERDGNGRETNGTAPGNAAVVKKLFKIDLAGAVDISAKIGADAAASAVPKTLFMDLVSLLTPVMPADQIPSKIEGIAFGPDVQQGTTTVHTLWVGNDNDFVQMTQDSSTPPKTLLNSNQIFVFGFTDDDLGGSQLVPQPFTTAGAVPPSGTGCNGVYQGTFNGNLTILVGQHCLFMDGAINGNVTVNGGDLTLSDSDVNGNVQVIGLSTFNIGPGSTIGGNLQIQNLLFNPDQDQICGAVVAGNLLLQNSGTAVLIGSPSAPWCTGNIIGGNLDVHNNWAAVTMSGNTVTGNLEVHNNTAPTAVSANQVNGDLHDHNNSSPTQVFNNAVAQSLQCQNNSSITGDGNTAGQEQGQCSTF
jgi:hypothetical protein